MQLETPISSQHLVGLPLIVCLSFHVMDGVNAVACGWPDTNSVISPKCIVMALAITYIMDSVKSSSLLCLSLALINEAESILCQSHFTPHHCA